MSATRKLRRQKLRRLSGVCYQVLCKAKAKAMHECRVCEAKKVENPFVVRFCPRHSEAAERDIKHHVLATHKGISFLTALKVGYSD